MKNIDSPLNKKPLRIRDEILASETLTTTATQLLVGWFARDDRGVGNAYEFLQTTKDQKIMDYHDLEVMYSVWTCSHYLVVGAWEVAYQRPVLVCYGEDMYIFLGNKGNIGTYLLQMSYDSIAMEESQELTLYR